MKAKDCPDIEVTSDASLPSSLDYEWSRDFLGNRRNKKSLVHYICMMLRESGKRLKSGKVLYVSFEKEVWRVSANQDPELLGDFFNNHEEADTRIFLLAKALKSLYSEVIVKSTDTDLLFVFLANHNTLKQAFYLLYSTGGQTKYHDCQKLVHLIKEDPDPAVQMLNSHVSFSKVLALVHFVSGSDDLSHLRGITKRDCVEAILKFGRFVFENVEEINDIFDLQRRSCAEDFLARFLATQVFSML